MMRTKSQIKFVSMLGVAIVILLAIILAEWGLMSVSRNNLLEEINQASSQGYDIEPLPTIDLFKTSLEDYSEMVNRPLFVEGRRPIEIDDSIEAVPFVAGKFEHLLIGVYGTEQGMSAIFKNTKARSDEPRYSKVFLGDDLVGWKVEEIFSDRVVLSQAGSQQQIRLHKPRLKAKTKSKSSKKQRFKNKKNNKRRSHQAMKDNDKTE